MVCVLFQTYIHIIDQRTRQPVQTKFYTDAMVVFHHVNAYEEDGCIVFDVIAYEDNSLYQLFYLANLNQDFKENSRLTSVPTLRRFAVPLHADKVMASKEVPFLSREMWAQVGSYFGPYLIDIEIENELFLKKKKKRFPYFSQSSTDS